MINLFVDILRISLGEKDNLSRFPTESEWKELYYLCERQAILAIVLDGISKLAEKGVKPPFNLLMEWIGASVGRNSVSSIGQNQSLTSLLN